MKKTLTLFIGLCLGLYSAAQITGDTSVCKGEISTYYVPYISGAGYYWNVTGGTLVGAPTADSVVIQWSNAGTAVIVLTQTNPSAAFTLNVTIHPLPNPVITHAAYPGCPGDTGTTQGGSGQPDNRPHCEKVCKLATVTYATPLHAGSTYQWYVNGAQTVTPNNDSVTVTWDTTAIGSVLVVETNQWGCVDSAYLCIEKIDLPVASFTHQANACKFSTVPFTNTSVGANSYQWYFGDGGSSTQQHPTHSYATAGNYTITLIAYNSCFCTDTFTGTISIDSLPGPDITCPSTVCAFDTATYSTAPSAGCTYNWFAIGGTITSGQGTPNVTVAWGAGQVGTLGLTITGCGTVCADTTLIQIPIVPAVATIMGDTVVCPGDCQTYTLPLFSGAGYTWNLSSGCGGVLSDSVCCNEVEICWPATAFGCNDTLTVQYYDSFLHCGGSGMLIIRVRPELAIFAPPSACANSSTSFFNSPGIMCTWSVSPAGPVVTPPIGTSTVISWNNLPGNYTVMAVPINPNQSCSPFALTNVAVSAKPAAPTITGDTVVCAGSSVSYCANPGINVTNWLVTGGTPATSVGSCVTVTWGNTGPYSISAFNQMPVAPGCSSDTTVQNIQSLTTLPVPNIIAGPNACANGTGTYTSTTPYPATATYTWSVTPGNAGSVIGGQGSQTATFEWGNNAPQNVTVTLTVNVCGQSVSNNAVVALNPAPIITAVQIGSLCAGGTAQVQATGGSTYQWSGPGGFASALNPATITTAGLYQVTATAVNGCTALSQVNVQYVSGPTASISTLNNLTYCIGQTYAVTMCALGNANYTYAWNAGPPNQCNTYTTPGAYSVVVTDVTNNCTALSNVLVIVEDSCNGTGPGTCQPNGSISFTHTSCNPISFTNTSVNAFGFSWNFGDFTGSNLTNPTHSYNQAGFYVVTLSGLVPGVTPPDTCIVSDTAQIEIPLKAKFDVDLGCWNDPVCFTDKSTFTAGNNITSWNWNFGDANTSNIQSPCHLYAAPGTYYVSLTVSNGLCTDVFLDTIVVPAKPTANFSFGTNTCINNPVQFTDLSFTAINYWEWNFGDAGTSLNQNPTHTYTVPGLYPVTLIVHDTSGCYDTVQQNIVISAPVISGNITAYPDTIVCAGTQVLLVAPFCATCPYIWSTGSTNDSIVVTATGVYSVTITDGGGCAYSTFITIIVNTGPPAIITNTGDDELCFGEFTNLAVPYSNNWLYLWNSNDPNVNGATSNAVGVVPTLAPGTYNYTVIITDTTTGCADTSLPYTIVVHALPAVPVITAIGATTVCQGDTITLVVTHPDPTVTFEWNNGEVNDTIKVTKNGCYYATAVDTNGCERTASFCVTVNPLPDLCTFYEGCYDTCAPYVIQGPAGTTWLWLMNGTSTGVTTQNFTATVSGMYSVIVTNSFGCVDTTGVLDLMLHPCPHEHDSLCADLTIDSVACDSTGKYILYYHVVNQSNVAVTQVNLEVLQPHLSVAFAPIINFITVPAGGNSGPLTTTIFNAMPEDTLCFRAHIAAFDSMGMETVCCYSDTECVVLPPCPKDSNCCAFNYLYDTVWCRQTPAGLVYDFTIRISGCGTLTLQHSNNTSLPGGNSYVLNNTTIVINGTYTPANATDTVMCITYLMGNGHNYCADTTICMKLRCKPTPPPGPCQLSFDNDICVGQTATFNYGANPTGLTFNWQFMNGSPAAATGPGPHNVTYTTAGCHQVICIITTPTNTIDCIDTICVHPQPQASIQPNGGTLNAFPGGMSYQWYSQNPNWTLLSGQTNQFYNPTSSGLYCVVVTNAFGCKDTSCIDFDYVGVEELTETSWNILPNPNQGAFALKFYSGAGEIIELSVTNAIGELVDGRTFEAHSGENHYYITNQYFAPGVYFVQLKTEKGKGVKRMIVR